MINLKGAPIGKPFLMLKTLTRTQHQINKKMWSDQQEKKKSGLTKYIAILISILLLVVFVNYTYT